MQWLADLFDRLSDCKVLVIGDIMVDHYIWGDAYRISPEAPVPVIDVENDTYRAGGAANVAANLKALGAQVELFGFVGGDYNGDILRRMMNEQGIEFDNRCVAQDFDTILKTRVVVRNQQLCRLDREPKLHDFGLENYLQLLEEKLLSADAVILSDYAKGVITQKLIDRVAKHSDKSGLFWSVDPKPKNFLSYEGASLITPNRVESLQMANLPSHENDELDVEKVRKVFNEKHLSKFLIITLGKNGMLLFKDGEFVEQTPTLSKEVYDVSGAGDTVISALTLALCNDCELKNAAYFANLAAGVVVGKVGTATVNRKEIFEYAQQISL